MTIECIAIDRGRQIQRTLTEHSINPGDFSLAWSFSGMESATHFLLQHSVDLVFLDLDLASAGVSEWYESLSYRPLLICFGTDPNNALTAFNMDAVDYLLKPLEKARLTRAIQKTGTAIRIKAFGKELARPYIFVQSEYHFIKIMLEDIHHIKALDDVIKIYRVGKPPVLTRITMRHLMDTLPPWQFLRIHRSYIVPHARIRRCDENQVFVGECAFPIGVTFREAVTRSVRKLFKIN